jgi:uncharacterized lipoprotein YddW (UPF0748 family)
MRFLILSACLALSAPHGGTDEVRAIWVTRFEYSTEADVKTILSNCAALGFNTILFQVRGQADACYESSIEPRAERLGPGFDPLGVACREAQRLGIALHAWINTMAAWQGTVPPTARNHVAIRHPDWIVVGKDGRRQRFNDHYLSLNPCLPEVREHLVSVVRDLASRYPIDGLHLDYVRFFEGDWSYDEKTLALFGFVTGGSPVDHPEAWTAFRRAAVTETVRMIRQAFKEVRPEGILSAADYPTAESRRGVHQDGEGWVRYGLIDWIFPMTYAESDAEFRNLLKEGDALFRTGGVTTANGQPAVSKSGHAVGSSTARAVCFPGVGAYRHKTAEQTVRQLRMCRDGFALFSYSSLYGPPNKKLCRARREAVGRFLSP